MEPFRIEPARNTPLISLKPDGNMKICGRSIHENVAEFYQPSFDWTDEYLVNPPEVTRIDIQLEYFNSASAKYIIKLLQKFREVLFKDKKLFISWFYEEGDEDILERGEYFSSVLDISFNFVEIT
jgi:hypothetical protein